ncbi:hypothetical protein K388_05860 [Streptomyces sp. KhCrAH-43]|nr:hypothetical protein K388_05860 [Streptomyces sp. KhCrAH-43]
MAKVNIAGLGRAAVLAALFNHTEPLGMGTHDPLAHTKLSVEEAQLSGLGEIPGGHRSPRAGPGLHRAGWRRARSVSTTGTMGLGSPRRCSPGCVRPER